MNAFELLSATTVSAATKALASAKPKEMLVKAGGIDVLDRLKERLDTPLRVLNIRAATDDGLREIKAGKDGGVVIGALCTLTQVAENDVTRKSLSGLARACGEAATPQVRNVATIGGNLCQKPRCWYFRSYDVPCYKKGGITCFSVFGDNRYHAIFGAKSCHIVHASNAALPLLAAGATVVAVRHEGDKAAERLISMDDFYQVPDDPKDDEHTLAPGELVREIRVPKSALGPKASYLEIREKASFDWPLVSCSVNLNDAAAPRVVLVAVAPIPWRLTAIEKMLAGKTIDESLLKQVREAAAEGAEPMTGNKYKVELVGVAVQRAIEMAMKPA